MSKLNLPLHPSMRHPLTGEPLRALYVDRHGRPRYPIMGGAPDPDPDPDPDPKPDPDPAPDPDPKPDDLGFPKDTAVAEMKPVEQAAYWKHQSQTHEGRNKGLLKLTGGKYGDALKADLDELARLKTASLTDGEKAVENAKAEGRRDASLAIAPQMFDVALQHVDADRRKVLIDSLDLSRVIKEDGTIDTDKVTSIATTLAPAPAKGEPDYGNGKRPPRASSGVGAGRDAYRAETGK